jgi:16S rRNA pseudouridine516 synthase
MARPAPLNADAMTQPMRRPQTAAQVLFSQGFGNRRECEARIRAGQLQVGGITVDDPQAPWSPSDGDSFDIDGKRWPYHRQALVLLHKPAGFECSARPQAHPSVLSLLPEPLRSRGVQPIGRLDADTTGLLLLTDNGALNHRLAGPKHRVPKRYQVSTRHPTTPEQIEALLAGVHLRDDPGTAVRALQAWIDESGRLQLVIDEGRYHQVKRMVAAVGNRVDALHRAAFGRLELPADLVAGAWRWVRPDEVWRSDRSSDAA